MKLANKANTNLKMLTIFVTIPPEINQFNSLPNDKILDQSKFKAFADNKRNVTKNLKFV